MVEGEARVDHLLGRGQHGVGGAPDLGLESQRRQCSPS